MVKAGDYKPSDLVDVETKKNLFLFQIDHWKDHIIK